MVKIIHFEVYADRGDGWKLVDQFSSDQRQEAVNLAKELEEDNRVAVKIIREIFDVQDNTYQESVEYISGLGRKSATSGVPKSFPPAMAGNIMSNMKSPKMTNRRPIRWSGL